LSHFTVVFDACVLAPASLRDLLVELSGARIFRGKWSNDIHREWMAAARKVNPGIDPAKLERTKALMNDFVLDSVVDGYQSLVAALNLPDPNDRHVLAAAIVCGADLIVTTNIKHFPVEVLEQYGMLPLHPDQFVQDILDLSEQTVLSCVKRIRERLKNPPMSAEQLLEVYFRNGLVGSVVRLREFASNL
jgi:hypothetical protein